MRPVRATALYIAWSFKAFALTGRQVTAPNNPGRCPGLRASALYLSLRPVTVGSGRAAYRSFTFQGVLLLEALGLQPVLKPLAKLESKNYPS